MATVVIPAREGSTRLPSKLLIEVKGKPIIRWTVESCLKIKGIDKVVVATDSKKIEKKLKDLQNIEIFFTPSELKSGTDRVAYVIDRYLNDEIIINIQGDEPVLPVDDICKLADFLENKDINVITIAHRLKKEKDYLNPNIVKVVLDENNYALYFSRSPIPYIRDKSFREVKNEFKFYKHIGIYGFKRDTLLKFSYEMEEAPLEKLEKLEQLRLLYNGYKIKVIISNQDTIGIDTEEDLIAFKNYLEKYNKNL